MLTHEQIHEIDRRLQAGEVPEAIASSLLMSYHQLRYALLASGKKWEVVTSRRLVDTAPARDTEEQPRAVAA